MTASSADTAELPRFRPASVAVQVGAPGESGRPATGGSAADFGPVAVQVPAALLDPDLVPLHDAGVPPADAAPEVPGPDPHVPPLRLAEPPAPVSDAVPAIGSPSSVPRRAERREERRLARRQQLLYSALGLSVLVGTLVTTVVVLDVTR